MKVLIWILTAFSVLFLNEILGMTAGFRLGPLFTYPLIFIIARWLCKSEDKKKHEERKRVFAAYAAADRAAMLAEAGLNIETEEEKPPEGWQACPTCGRLVREGYLCSVCKPTLEEMKECHAGVPVESLSSVEDKQKEVETEHPTPLIRYCWKCGAKLLEDSNFCSACGAPKGKTVLP